MFGERERPEGCLTDLTFDAWFAGELTAAATAAAEAHIATCDRCRNLRAEFAAQRQAFFAVRPALESKSAPVARRRRRALVSLGAFAAAAALAVVVSLVQVEPEPVVRAKGGPSIGFFVERGGSAKRGTAGEVVYPGDRVHFTYTSDKPRYLAIYSIDSRGAASAFFPDGDRAERLSAGSDSSLSSAVELDDAPGLETVFAVFCDSDFSVEQLRKSLAERRSLEAPSGCSLDVLTWAKGRAN
jgi:hypothetical protein